MQNVKHIAQNTGHITQNDGHTMQNVGHTTRNVGHNTLKKRWNFPHFWTGPLLTPTRQG